MHVVTMAFISHLYMSENSRHIEGKLSADISGKNKLLLSYHNLKYNLLLLANRAEISFFTLFLKMTALKCFDLFP